MKCNDPDFMLNPVWDRTAELNLIELIPAEQLLCAVNKDNLVEVIKILNKYPEICSITALDSLLPTAPKLGIILKSLKINTQAINLYGQLLSNNSTTKDICSALDLFIKQGCTNILKYTLQINGKHILETIQSSSAFDKYIEYFNKNSISYKYQVGSYIAGVQDNFINELLKPGNDKELAISSQTVFIADRIMFKHSACQVQEGKYLYVINTNGDLHIYPQTAKTGQSSNGETSQSSGSRTDVKHSYFFKGHHDKNKDEATVGIGQHIACPGHLRINEEGQIIEINNKSGHYKPNIDQLLVAVYNLAQQNVLSPNIKITDRDGNRYNIPDTATYKAIMDQYAYIPLLTVNAVGVLADKDEYVITKLVDMICAEVLLNNTAQEKVNMDALSHFSVLGLTIYDMDDS